MFSLPSVVNQQDILKTEEGIFMTFCGRVDRDPRKKGSCRLHTEEVES